MCDSHVYDEVEWCRLRDGVMWRCEEGVREREMVYGATHLPLMESLSQGSSHYESDDPMVRCGSLVGRVG